MKIQTLLMGAAIAIGQTGYSMESMDTVVAYEVPKALPANKGAPAIIDDFIRQMERQTPANADLLAKHNAFLATLKNTKARIEKDSTLDIMDKLMEDILIFQTAIQRILKAS